MIAFLLMFAVISQAIPIRSDQGGAVTGIVRDTAGKAVSGMRVATVAAQGAADDVVLSAITETDGEGRYRLENIPPGRYYIAAGRVDLMTYFPGTLDPNEGTVIAIAPGINVSNIDFGLIDDSVVPRAFVRIPFEVRVEGDNRFPLSGPAGSTRLRFTPTVGRATTLPLDMPYFMLPSPGPDYRIALDNLPPGFILISITYGATNLMTDTLKVPSANTTLNVGSVTKFVIQSGRIFNVTAAAVTGASPAPVLSITLAHDAPPAQPDGVRVAGRVKGNLRSIYLSGMAGVVFSDGTFEFRVSAPGRYTLFAPVDASSAHPLAASIVVGNRDIDGVELEDTPVFPLGFDTVRAPEPASGHAPGATIPLAMLKGTVVDKRTNQPINGTASLSGGAYRISAGIGDDGRFEFPRLLPGEYTIEISPLQYETVKQVVIIGDDDINLAIAAIAIGDAAEQK